MSVIFIGPKRKPITGQSLSFHNISSGFTGFSYTICYGGKNIISTFLSTLISALQLLILCMKGGYEKIYITTSRSRVGFIRDFIYIHIAHAFSIKIINHLHGADFKPFYYSLPIYYRFFVDLAYTKINCSIVLLPRMREQYSMYPNMAIVSISNGVKEPKFTPSYNKKKKMQVLYLSNIMYSKGISYLISSIDKLNNAGYCFELIIAGSILGDEDMNTNDMNIMFHSLIKGKSHIRYVGVKSDDEKEKLLHESMFFILPTFYKTEAQPLSIIEAMRNGCAIITTNHNYIPDFIDNSNGMLIEPKSDAAIENALLSLAGNKSKLESICNFNIDYANDNFSLNKHTTKIYSLLNR